MDESGCASHVFIMSVFTQPDFAEKLMNSFTFSATVTEEGTGEPKGRCYEADSL